MKTIIYAIGALALSSSLASAEVLKPHPSSGHAVSTSYARTIPAPRLDSSSTCASEIRRAPMHSSYPAHRSLDDSARWDGNDNNG